MDHVPGGQAPSSPTGSTPVAGIQTDLKEPGSLLNKLITRIRSVKTPALAMCLALLAAVVEYADHCMDQDVIELVRTLADRDDLQLDNVARSMPEHYPPREIWLSTNNYFQGNYCAV